MVCTAEYLGALGGAERGVAVERRAVGMLDRAQPCGEACFAGGNGLAVGPSPGTLGQGLAVLLDFAEVGFAVAGVGGDGV